MRRRTVTWAILLALASAGLALAPGFDILSYYFCLPVSALVAMACGGLAVTAGGEARRAGLPYSSGVRRAACASLALVAIPWAVITANALRVGPCDYAYGLLFYLAGPIASAACGLALGAAASALVTRPLLAHLAFLVAFVAPFVADAFVLYREPAVFFYDPFLGYFPGPIYDDRIEVGSAYAVFRVACLLAAAGALALGRAVAGQRWAVDRRPGWWAVSAACLGACVTLWGHGGDFGFRGTREAVEAELSGRTSDAWCDVRHDPGLDEAIAARILRDCGFRHRQALAFFGLQPGKPVRVWLYPDAAAKARLMGARDVEVTKPWLGEVHLADLVPGEPVLGHEVAHVVAGRLADNFLHLPLVHGVAPDMGLVEGLAVAAAFADDGPSPHEWSLAMALAGVRTDPSDLLGGPGFVTAHAARAYTLAGSFVRFLAETRGTAVLRDVAAGRGVETATGQDLAALVGEWRAYLDEVAGATVDDRLVRRAAARFEGPGVLGRKCPADTARLAAGAREAMDAGDPAAGAACLEAAIERGGGGASMRRELARFLAAAGDAAGVETILAAFGEGDEASTADLVARADALAILALSRGEPVPREASVALGAALLRSPSGPDARAIVARLLAIRLPQDATRRVFVTLAGVGGPRPDLDLAEAVAAAPDSALLRYLLGRALARAGAFDAAADSLAAALDLGLPPLFRFEAVKGLGESEYWAGRIPDARSHLAMALSGAPHRGDRMVVEEYLARIAGE